MRKSLVILIFVFLLINPIIFALSEQQSEKLKNILNLVKDDKHKFQQVMDLLNRKKVDLREEEVNVGIIKAASERHGIELKQYSNIRGIRIELLPYLLTAGGILLIIIGFELYRKMHKTPEHQELHELSRAHQVHTPSPQLYNLQQYVKTCAQRGYTKEGIKQTLLKQGWDTRTINSVLNQFMR
jgi:hypothetical protein